MFGLTIGLKKTNILGQDVCSAPGVLIDDYTLEVVDEFVYHIQQSLGTELDKRIDKAATALARLTKKVWNNAMVTTKTKMVVYKACMLSTLLYGCGTWTLYNR